MVDEIFDKKQTDEKIKNLINSFLNENKQPEKNCANDTKNTLAEKISKTTLEKNIADKTIDKENALNNIVDNDTTEKKQNNTPTDKNLENALEVVVELDKNKSTTDTKQPDLEPKTDFEKQQENVQCDDNKEENLNEDDNTECDEEDETVDDEPEELSEEEKLALSQQLLENKYNTIYANLLGEFDADGNYKINDFIMVELLTMPKRLDRTIDGTMELTAEYKDGTLFSFTVSKPQILENGDALVNLILNEKIEFLSGKQTQFLSTIVGSYCYKFSDDFKVKEMLVFSIYEPDDPGLKARTPTDYIDLKKEYNNAVLSAGKDLFEKLEETYFIKHIQILNSIKNGAVILSLFNEKRKILDQKFANNPNGKFKALNDLLEELLKSPFGFDILNSLDYQTAMQLLNLKYMETAKKISAIILEHEKVQELKRKRAEKEAQQLGIYITEILRNRGNHGPLVAGAIAEAKKQEAKKQEAKKAMKADAKAKGGGGKKGGGKKGGGGKKKSKGKDKGKPKKVLATGKPQKPVEKPVEKISAEERYWNSRGEKAIISNKSSDHRLIINLGGDTAKPSPEGGRNLV